MGSYCFFERRKASSFLFDSFCVKEGGPGLKVALLFFVDENRPKRMSPNLTLSDMLRHTTLLLCVKFCFSHFGQ